MYRSFISVDDDLKRDKYACLDLWNIHNCHQYKYDYHTTIWKNSFQLIMPNTNQFLKHFEESQNAENREYIKTQLRRTLSTVLVPSNGNRFG